MASVGRNQAPVTAPGSGGAVVIAGRRKDTYHSKQFAVTMNGRLVAGGVLLLVFVAGVAAFAAGLGPAPGGDSGGGELTDVPTGTGTIYGGSGTATDDGGSDGGGSDGSTATAESGPPFVFEVTEIDECGRTCRDVTVTLFNEQEDTATGVTIYTRIFAGNSTDESDKVWEGKEDVGRLEGGGSVTATKRVELSLMEANQVRENDGWVTVLTTVRSDETTITFRSREQVL